MPGKKFRILVAPLQWGIGHATRCVPLIRMLLQKGTEVTIATSGRALSFLQIRFPELECVRAEGINVSYPEKGSMAMKMALSSPAFLLAIYREHRWLDRFIDEYGIDAVISDNRFGFWSHRVPSVYMTHQLVIKMPAGTTFLEPLTRKAHYQFIRRYDECWIPDTGGRMNLSGDLSHKYPVPPHAHFVGPMTRFSGFRHLLEKEEPKDRYDLLVMLSGPEPQRSMLEKMLRKILTRKPDLKVAMLQGRPGSNGPHEENHGMRVFSHLPDHRIASLILNSRMILCRPGFSTIMDLVALKKSALLVPTPGQTEQEYLGEYLARRGWYRCIPQSKIKLDNILDALDQEPLSIPDFQDSSLLEERVDHLLEIIGLRKS